MKHKIIFVFSLIMIIYGLIGSFISFISGKNYIQGGMWGMGAEAKILFLIAIIHLIFVMVGTLFILVNKKEIVNENKSF